MRKAFGVSVNSLSSVQNYLCSVLPKNNVYVLKSDWTEKASNASVLLLPNVNLMKNKITRKKLNDFKGVVLIFDSPINLYGIPKLQWLDVKRGESNLSYKFEFMPIDYSKILTAVKTKKNKVYKYKHYDILGSLVNERMNTPFLRVLSDFIYFCLGMSSRDVCKKAIATCIASKEFDVTSLHETLKPYCMEPTALNYLLALTDYLQTDYGNSMHRVVRLFERKKIKDYKSKCSKLQVDVQDVRWVIKVLKVHRENVKMEA